MGRKVCLIVVVLAFLLVGCKKEDGRRLSSTQTNIIGKPEQYLRIDENTFIVAFSGEEESERVEEKDGAATWYSQEDKPMVTNKYIITSIEKMEYYYSDIKGKYMDKDIVEIQFEISLYESTNEMKYIKTIDVLSVVREQIDNEFLEGKFIISAVRNNIIEINDKTYYLIRIFERIEDDNWLLYLDVESEKVYFQEEVDFSDTGDNAKYSILNSGTDFFVGKRLAAGRGNRFSESMYVVIRNGSEKEYEEGIKLFEVYPEVLEYFESGYRNVDMYFYHSNPEGVASLILNSGIYDEYVLPAEYSKDGEEHQINSMADFLEWYERSDESKYLR